MTYISYDISAIDKMSDVISDRICIIKRRRGYQISIIKRLFATIIFSLLLGMNIPNGVAGELQQLNYFPTWDGGIIQSTDASGICYHAPSGHLFITDSEIEENPEWNGFNIFETSLLGNTLFNSYDSVGRGNYREPAGITYNSFDGYFYIVDDNTRDIYRYDINFGNFITYVHLPNDVPDSGDPEGITSDPSSGYLYVVVGSGAEKQVLVYNSNLQYLNRFNLDPSINDPTGIAFDPKSNHLIIIALQPGPDILFEYTLDGTYVDQYSLEGLLPQAFKPEGVVFAPPSDPNSNPDDLSLYIVDMKLNNIPDGGVYEVKLLCTPTGAEICDNLDNNCDGQVDEENVCGLRDIVIDFGPTYGLWVRYNDATWTKLNRNSPEIIATGDIDGYGKDDVIMDFGPGIGIWIRYNNTTWTKLHSLSAEIIATGDIDGSGQDDIILDFGSAGIWIRYNNTTWKKLHSTSPEGMAVGDINGSGQDDVIIDFGSAGIWIRFNNNTWTKLHNQDPVNIATGDIDGSGQDDVIVDFGSSDGIWVWYNNVSWGILHS